MTAARLSTAALGLALLAFAGCNPAAKALGKWELETDKLKLQAPATGESAAAALLASMSLFVQVRADLELKADNTWRLDFGAAGNTQSQTGTWKYIKTEGDTLVLQAKPDKGDEQRELKLKIVDAEHLEASGLLGDQVFPLKRKSES